MANEDEATIRDDGTQRKFHYGAGRQPWDDMVAAGWAVHFAAATILRYMRRTKEPAHSLESARWYWARLNEFIADRANMPRQRLAMDAKRHLMSLLTDEEFAKLRR